MSLVTTEYVAKNLQRLRIIDGSWHLPLLQRNAANEYLKEHIPGAVFFDIDEIAEHSTNLPHMLPSKSQFELSMRNFGISNHDEVVVYDTNGVGPACRVYWTFKVFGHQQVHVMNGGLPKWKSENRPIESLDTVRNTSSKGEPYQAIFQPHLVKNYTNIISNKTHQIVDARPAARFNGESLEPRPNLPSGHIPNSLNVPFTLLTDSKTSTLLPVEELRKVFNSEGVDIQKPTILTCGSGITASVLYFALDHLGSKNLSLYDGSWAEYASKADSPIESRGPTQNV